MNLDDEELWHCPTCQAFNKKWTAICPMCLEPRLDMETYEYVTLPPDADLEFVPIVVEEGSSDGVDPEENDEAIEVANVKVVDNPDGGTECEAEGENEEVGEAESGEADPHMGEAVKEVEYNAKAEGEESGEEKSDVAGPSRMRKRRLTKRGPKNQKKKFNLVKDFQKYCSASDTD